jgi:Fe(3+) dicitrate transport protein
MRSHRPAHRAPTRVAAALGALLGASTAAAQDRPAAPPEPTGGEATVVGSSSRALSRLPGATTVVGERELERTQPLSAGEALRRVPGLYVRDEEGMGLRPNLGVRGLDPTRSRRVLILEDGMPISLAPYSEPEMYYNPPIERMGRVEVIRGAGSILYGPQTIGGVINYVTAPVPDRLHLTLRTTLGDRGLFIGHMMAGDRVGNVGYTVSVLRRQGAGFRQMGFEATDVFGKLVVRLDARQELLVRIGVYDETSHATYLGLTSSMYERDPTQNPVPGDVFDLRRYGAGVVHTWRPGPSVELRTMAYGYTTGRDWSRQIYDRDPVAGVSYERVAGDPAIPRGAVYLRNQMGTNARGYCVAGVESRLRVRFGTGPLRHELDTGVRVLAEDMILRRLLGETSTDRTGAVFAEDVRRGVALSGYLQDRVNLIGRLEFIPGLRVESFFFEREIRRDAGMLVNRTGGGSTASLIPGATLRWAGDTVTVFGGVHLGYAPPRIAAAITPMGTDSQLAAERSINSELGVRVERGAALRAEATAFWTEFQNEIVTVGGNESEFRNGGTTRHLGVEAAATFDLGRAQRWGTSVFASARYTFVDARLVRSPNDPDGSLDGNLVPYAVPHTMVLSGGFEAPFGLGAQATWSYASRHFTDTDNTPEATPDGVNGPIPAYWTLDLALRYSHRRSGLGATLAVKSVQGYVTDAQGRPNTYIASRAPDGIFPGGFGQVMVGLRYDR